jgi:pyridoxamine 5'-phosphate oxidase
MDHGVDLYLRADYDWGVLLETDAADDPVVMLDRWLAEAQSAGVPEANAMALVTVDDRGRPRPRNVLLRGVDDAGRLWFFTNRDSRKGRDLAERPEVGLLFSWLGIHRQVRVQGRAEPLEDDESDRYFATRPRDSRVGAWASPQSEVLSGRDELEARVAEFTERFEGGDVPRPPYWGGYAVTPEEFEFWQGRPSRLHDRLRYRRPVAGEQERGAGWVIERLAP